MEPVKIVIDTREQLPYAFESENIEVVRKALPAGDYSLEGFETVVAIERKTLDDFVNSVIHDRERFFKELRALTSYDRAFVVVEGSQLDVLKKKYRSDAHPNAVIGAAIAIYADLNIPVYFCDRRQGARLFVETLLLAFHRKHQRLK